MAGLVWERTTTSAPSESDPRPIVIAALVVAVTASLCVLALSAFAAWQLWFDGGARLQELIKMTSAFTTKSIGRTLPIEVLEILAVKICANVELMKAEQRQFGESLEHPGVLIKRQNEPKERTNLETSDSNTTQFGPNTVKKIEADAGYEDVGPPMSTDLQSQALLKPKKTIALPTQRKAAKPPLPTQRKGPKPANPTLVMNPKR